MTKPAYERPVFIRHQMGLMNKFGRARSTPPVESIDGAPVDALLEEFGSPLFVFSQQCLIDRYRDLHDSFARRWAKVRIAWSYKTNYLDAICRTFHDQGAWAEVVSDFELDKALHLGIPAERIHFNGPYKSKETLERALPAGVMVHLDSYDELACAEEVAREQSIRPGVAIRGNLMTDSAPHWGRFGFSLESGQALDAVKRILAGDQLELVGLHCHLGTFILDESAYRQAAEKLAAFASELRKEHGITLDFIDLGGGFASHNSLKAQYLPGEQATPSFDRYAEALCDGLSKLEYPANEMPTLVLETGRALVDDAGTLLATVIANKRLPDGTRALVIDAGVNILFTSFWYQHEVIPTRYHDSPLEPTIIYGPLCMNIDVVRDAVLFPSMQAGEHVALRNVGAYNVTQWMQFITYRPSVVMIDTKGTPVLIRRRETLDTILAQEVAPE